MFHGNYITGGVFNINLAPAKNGVTSPDVDPKRKKRRLIIESDLNFFYLMCDVISLILRKLGEFKTISPKGNRLRSRNFEILV